MINRRRQQRNIPAQYSISDLLNMFKGGPSDTPRSRQKPEQLNTIQEGLNIPPVVPMAAPSLLEAQPQELATGLMQITPTTDITTGQTVNMETLMKPLLPKPKTQNNLLTKKEEEEIAKNPETLQKYSRAGNFFSRLGGFQTASPELLAQALPEELDIYNKQRLTARNKGIGEMLFMLSDALGGKDIAMRALERQESLAGSQQQIQALQNAGFTEQEINMVLAGLNPKDVMEFRKTDMSGQQIIKSVEENVEQTVKETEVLDTFANLDQAFGPVDALQEGISKATRVLGFDIDPKTGAAVRARNSLNTEILANLAADFTGKPNMLIYENIKGNLPMSAATSHADAREKYENIRDQVDARINALEEGLKSSILSDATKNSYRDELNKSILLSKKLDSAILSLTGKKEETLKPQDFVSEGKYSNLYTNG